MLRDTVAVRPRTPARSIAVPPHDEAPLRGSDSHLVEAARGGDRRAMTELHKRYAPMVHAILLTRLQAQHAEDGVQDVFLHAISQLHSLREPSAFAGWLATIARNRARDHHRRAKITRELHEGDLAAHQSESAALDARQVLVAIRALPSAYRETLVMRLVEGMSGPEIAASTGLTAASVRVNLHRGLRLLRDKLGLDEVP
jgi:RNA polymerase sigma-70 factor (ECF subfamily)